MPIILKKEISSSTVLFNFKMTNVMNFMYSLVKHFSWWFIKRFGINQFPSVRGVLRLWDTNSFKQWPHRFCKTRVQCTMKVANNAWLSKCGSQGPTTQRQYSTPSPSNPRLSPNKHNGLTIWITYITHKKYNN